MKKFLIVLLALMLPLCVALAEDDENWVDTSNAPELPGGTLTASLRPPTKGLLSLGSSP